MPQVAVKAEVCSVLLRPKLTSTTVKLPTMAVALTSPVMFWLPNYIYAQDPWGEFYPALEWQQYEVSYQRRPKDSTLPVG